MAGPSLAPAEAEWTKTWALGELAPRAIKPRPTRAPLVGARRRRVSAPAVRLTGAEWERALLAGGKEPKKALGGVLFGEAIKMALKSR